MSPRPPTRKAAARPKTKAKTEAPAKTNAKARTAKSTRPAELLSGGNPRIAKADGDAPVAAWIAGLPGWKREVARWLDEVIVREVRGVKKAVKWNSPFYGVEGRGFFVGVHAFDRYLKVTFFKGASLSPLPPESSKVKDVRYLHLSEDGERDEAQLASWVRQAAALPGWMG